MANSDERKPSKEKQGGVPLWAWGALAVVATGLFFYQLSGKDQKPSEPIPASPEAPSEAVAKAEDPVKNRGRILLVGDLEPARFSVEGSEPVPLREASDITTILDRDDEGALAEALTAQGIRHLAVATSLANPATLPKVTLLTRLSLFKPLDRFHPIFLTPRFGLWEVAAPETLSDASGRILVELCRSILEGQNPPEASAMPPELTSPRPSEVSVMIQGLNPIINQNTESTNWRRNRRDLYVVRKGENLYLATVLAAREIRERFIQGHAKREGPLEQAMERLTIEVEVFQRPTRVDMLQGSLSNVDYDQHLWRSIELGVFGLRGATAKKRVYLLPTSAIYWSRETVAQFVDRIGRMLYGKGRDERHRYRTDESLVMERFATFHFREMTPDGEVLRMRRGVPAVDPEQVTRPAMIDTVSWASHWLVDNIHPDTHAFRYKYFPTTDMYLEETKETSDRYNEVRHALAVYGLYMAYSALKEPWILAGADSAKRFIMDRVVMGPAWFEGAARQKLLPETRALPFGPPKKEGGVDASGEWLAPDGRRLAIPRDMGYLFYENNAKMGGAAGTVLMLSEMILAQPDKKGPLFEQAKPYLEALGRFLVFMQRPDGAFYHYFVAPGHGYYNVTTTIYPGEVMFALARLHRMLGDKVYLEAFDKAHRYYKAWFTAEEKIQEPDGTYAEPRRLDLVQFVPWISMAENEMHSQVRDPDYAAFGVHVSDWIVDYYQFNDGRTFYPSYLGGYYKIATEMPAMHGCVYTEGTAAAFELARRSGQDDLAAKMARSTILGCRFAMQQIFVPGRNLHFVPNPPRCVGGAQYAINRSKLRIDYSYHSLSAMVQALRNFDARWLPEGQP